MILEDLGFNNLPEKSKYENSDGEFVPGRVAIEHKERYVVLTAEGEFEAEVTGNLRFSAKSREDFPAVGDWVMLKTFDSGFAVIHKIYSRYSVIKREAAGEHGTQQIIAANIDCALILQAADRDFNINRLERYLTICYEAKVTPVIVISKTDLRDQQEMTLLLDEIRARINDVPVFPISNLTQSGYSQLKEILSAGKTYCVLGSSGVGKSTLINNLAGREILRTSEISESTKKGRHTTNRRELHIQQNGSILVDTPGMREVGIADAAGGLEITFGEIFRTGKECRFSDCRHIHEKGCAVLKAVEEGVIDRKSYDNYLKMEKEREFFEMTAAERHEKERAFGKMLKDYKKGKFVDGRGIE
ncbi:MAG TPA: ribosome small subunit-dependent GTPase A [Ignavibacteriaceae bacterium]|jgi:ribosome biogenesis GTPase|nr:ribosome small subunit-dependent GTPase A [Ignavibacteriaceae bacterium]HOJ18271.1 ribosome small subunit-dependent GTPase A [Ignavibacteriaceae bacterium]HPO57186.1 ribosome small subunit-dependent GTPase A [Ignavibacteriaceae bacterium]